VVSADCDSTNAEERCHAASKALSEVGRQLPQLNLDAACKRLHTGSFWSRVLDEIMMNSSSYDGFKLLVSADIDDGSLPDAAVSVAAQSNEACQDAAAAIQDLAKQGLKLNATCDANQLYVR
jgi:hypothetical protein